MARSVVVEAGEWVVRWVPLDSGCEVRKCTPEGTKLDSLVTVQHVTGRDSVGREKTIQLQVVSASGREQVNQHSPRHLDDLLFIERQ